MNQPKKQEKNAIKAKAAARRSKAMIRWRKFKYFIWKSCRFVTYDIWRITTQDVTGMYRWLINIAKALILSVRFFLNDRMQEKASALTYNTLLALVPLLALALGISRGFGIQDVLQDTMQHAFPGQTSIINYGFEFADAYLTHAKTGIFMGFGILMLLWVIISLIGNIETVFNQIWQQKRSRSMYRKFTDYLSIIIIVPVLIFISSGVQIFLQTFLKTGYFDEIISNTMLELLKVIPYVLTTLVFSGAYMIIPNTKVRFTNALIAGAIAGSGFQIFQMLYINGQIWVSKYNAIYGSFAALPLLLLWIQMSWIICLYGAELAYASQNIQNFNFEKDTQNISRRYFDFVTIIVASVICSRFKKEQELLSTDEIATYLHLPSKLTSQVVSELDELGLICETPDKTKQEHHVWIPAIDINKFSIGLLLERINNHGREDLKMDYAGTFRDEWNLLRDLHQKEIDCASVILLCDVDLPKEI